MTNPMTTPESNRPLAFWLRQANRSIRRGIGDMHPRDAAGDIDHRISEALTPEQYTEAVAALQTIARTFGWDEQACEHHHGHHGSHRHGHPHAHRRGGRGFGPAHHRGADTGAFERGFLAGERAASKR